MYPKMCPFDTKIKNTNRNNVPIAISLAWCWFLSYWILNIVTNSAFNYPFWENFPCIEMFNFFSFDLDFFIYYKYILVYMQYLKNKLFHGFQWLNWPVLVGLQHIPKPSGCMYIFKRCGTTSPKISTVQRLRFSV